MRYEWDERKREANLRKHGLDFVRAHSVFEAAWKTSIELARATDQEPRLADFAEVDGVVLMLVYTMRADAVRCISLRPASKRERRAFYEISHHTKDH
jgi:uncharacterized DUF497 family protein